MIQKYDKGALFVNGTCLAEWQEGTAEFPGTWEPVQTMAGGGTIRGFSRAEGRGFNTNFTIRIRQDGTEYKTIRRLHRDGSDVIVSVWTGGVQDSSEGKIDLGNIDMKAGTMEVKFQGTAPISFGL